MALSEKYRLNRAMWDRSLVGIFSDGVLQRVQGLTDGPKYTNQNYYNLNNTD